jgi:HAD superfamily hydrolase (TIGR01509 family)
MASLKVNILIPMAGRGSRFATQNFVQPKPLIDVAGRSMISWVVNNVDSDLIEARFIFLVLREHDQEHGLTSFLKALKPNVDVVYVDAVTEGAACTTLLARRLIDNDTPLLIANSDQYVEWSADDYWRRMASQLDSSDGDVLCFHIPMEANDTKWSYAAVDGGGRVTDIQEKVVISENATVGYYYWRRGSQYVTLTDAMIAKDVRVNGEFYVAPVYNEGVAAGLTFRLSFCDKMWGLGVPHDLTRFLTGYVRDQGRAKVALPSTQPAACGPMRFVAHRGNLTGADPANENRPEYIAAALRAGFDVELDAWYDPSTGTWALGHDVPQYAIPFDFLLQDRLWVHCKNGAALRKLCTDARVNCFTHDADEFTLTSKNQVWIYPDKELQGPNSVAVMFSEPMALLDQDIFGVCADNVADLRRAYVARQLPRAASRPNIQLVIFDLDGVLVESKDLHYDALNDAIACVAGASFVISRPEHETVYDGLSTNQKLRLLTIHKNLPLDAHKPIWTKKQELTEAMVRDQLKPDALVLDAIKKLKSAGYPVAVASNCIQSSVHSILDAIGALPLVDAFFSNEDVDNAKPAPDIYLKACATFGVPPSAALVVEDSVKGFEACVRADCHLFKVTGPTDVRADAILSRVATINESTVPITVVVPLAGNSQLYWADGPEAVPSEVPSFLGDANGAPAVEWVVRPLLSSRYDLRFVFVVKESQSKKYRLDSLLPRIVGYRPTKVVPVHGETLGALKTVLLAKDAIPADAPVLFCTCSNVTAWHPGSSVDDLIDAHADGAIATFDSTDPRCSFVRLHSNSDIVVDVHEKAAVSSVACTGLYFWRRAVDFFAAARSQLQHRVKHRGLYFLAPTYNEAVRAGLSFKVVPAQACWSVRSMFDVSEFANAYVSKHVENSMTRIYDEMEARQAKAIAEHGFNHDPTLRGTQAQRCLAAYTLCTYDNFHAFASLDLLMGRLQEAYGDAHVLYRLRPDRNHVLFGRLHMTFMQLLGFDIYGTVALPKDYSEVLESVLLRVLRPFEVHFTRVIVTRASVLLVGHPTVGLNHVREQVRDALARVGYPLYEPYKNDIAHVTLMRFAAPLQATEYDALRSMARCSGPGRMFASLAVDALDVSAASWKMQPAELEGVHSVELS